MTEQRRTGTGAVVVPARNEAGCIAVCLRSVQSALAAAGCVGWEVLVVDDASTDGTGEVASAHGAKVVRRSSRGGPLAAWADGVRESDGEILVLLDGDCHVDRDAIAELKRALESPGVGVAAGRAVPTAGTGHSIATASASFSAALLHETKRRLRDHDFIPIGRLMALRRESWLIESQDVGPCDRAVARAALSGGWRVVYVPSAVVHYTPIATVEALWHDYLRTRVAPHAVLHYDRVPFGVAIRSLYSAGRSAPLQAGTWSLCQLVLAVRGVASGARRKARTGSGPLAEIRFRWEGSVASPIAPGAEEISDEQRRRPVSG